MNEVQSLADGALIEQYHARAVSKVTTDQFSRRVPWGAALKLVLAQEGA